MYLWKVGSKVGSTKKLLIPHSRVRISPLPPGYRKKAPGVGAFFRLLVGEIVNSGQRFIS